MQTQSSLQFRKVVITGDRVRLVPITEEYAHIIFEEFTDEITKLMVPATPDTVEQVYEFIRKSIENMEDNIELTFTILENDSDEFLGVCGLHGQNYPNEPILGTWLKKDAHGNRYGQEAIKFLADWARKNLIFKFMVYPCDKNNVPSRKIAESLNGKIFRKGEVKSMDGRILNEIAYKIV